MPTPMASSTATSNRQISCWNSTPNRKSATSVWPDRPSARPRRVRKSLAPPTTPHLKSATHPNPWTFARTFSPSGFCSMNCSPAGFPPMIPDPRRSSVNAIPASTPSFAAPPILARINATPALSNWPRISAPSQPQPPDHEVPAPLPSPRIRRPWHVVRKQVKPSSKPQASRESPCSCSPWFSPGSLTTTSQNARKTRKSSQSIVDLCKNANPI